MQSQVAENFTKTTFAFTFESVPFKVGLGLGQGGAATRDLFRLQCSNRAKPRSFCVPVLMQGSRQSETFRGSRFTRQQEGE